MSIGNATKDEHTEQSQRTHQTYTEQWTLSVAVGRAEGMQLKGMSTFVLPGVHTGLMPRLSRETVELTPCSGGTTSKCAMKEQRSTPRLSSIR